MTKEKFCKTTIKIAISGCLAIFLLAGCAKAKPKVTQPVYMPPGAPSGNTYAPQPVNAIRLQAIQDTAMSYGAQNALSWRSKQLNNTLLQEQDYLNSIFNFNSLILKNNVLPPVLAEGNMPLTINDPYTLRLADHVYRIVQPPRFVTTPPSWRDYLWLNYQPPEPPNSTLLPKTNEEAQIWNKNIKLGWKAGIDQANQIFSVNLGRLKRDYDGMILYRKLLAQNMVTPPYVAKLDLGVTGNGKAIRVNDQVLRITAISELNPNAKAWKPVVRPGEAGGDDPDVDQADP